MDALARGRSVTWLSIWANVALGLTKVLVGWWGHSRALMADGLHSLTDLASDGAVLVGLAISARPPDENHPYGHQKAASLATLVVASSLLVFCILITFSALQSLQSGSARVPHLPTLGVALISIGIKELLFRRTRAVGEATGSRMLLANAWHHRTDSATSVVAAAGITAVLVLGEEWAFLDAVAGIVLAVWIGVEGVRLLRSAVDELMDSAPERTLLDDLREHILTTEGALAYHDFRARRVGARVNVDFHLLVEPELSITDAHMVAHRVKEEMLAQHPEVLDVLIHVEPGLPAHHRKRGMAGGSLPPEGAEAPDRGESPPSPNP
jgi:cation diffusion facilitator family transporter